MDRTMKQRLRLMEAEARVAEGERGVALQKRVIRELEAHGEDSRAARKVLARYKKAQAVLVGDRDRLAKELAGRAN
jgi:uncharacterized coiled-coil protein SlyX